LSAGSLARTSRQTKQAIGAKYADVDMAILLWRTVTAATM